LQGVATILLEKARAMTGAQYIAEFLARVGSNHVFLLTGGACAFMVDEVARHKQLHYTCFQHEQSAAMAADALWRTERKVGVSMATSGPGATNLITGIACSYFDSIPSLHVTGQVNQREASSYHGAKVRQTGFQETKIVEMVRPITKYAVMVRSGDELRHELAKAYAIATSGRMGPVLVDVPMDIQQIDVGAEILIPLPLRVESEPVDVVAQSLSDTLAASQRPVVLFGGGVGLANVQRSVAAWLESTGLPFVASWAGLTWFDHGHPGFHGQIGVYGNRGANFILQNADCVIVLGSRLDNRQRSGNPSQFATGANVHVVDVDVEELKKYLNDGYRTNLLDFAGLPEVLERVRPTQVSGEWLDYARDMKTRYYGKEFSASAERLKALSPYQVVRRIAEMLDDDAIVATDTGACVCWVHQAFKVRRHVLFTAGGNSPMGYALPAAIGAKRALPWRQVVCITGDGGFQLNLQELQTLSQLGLDIIVIVMNNASYGIIKQFQDSYLGGRYLASQEGYSVPDFCRVAQAYGLRSVDVRSLDDLSPGLFTGGSIVVNVVLHPDLLIEPKLELGRPINDQFPYLEPIEYAAGNRFVDYPRPPRVDGPEPARRVNSEKSDSPVH
jgi:acetolactate synthase I/II/III large subunit